MKKLLVVMVLVVASAGFGAKKGLVDEFSGQGYGPAGCGLGSILFGAKPGFIQVIAATVNGTFGSQTFGISSGTSNCGASAFGGSHAKLFIDANQEALENDIARGNGETVATLGEILGCSKPEALGAKLQPSYGNIFQNVNAPSEAVTESIFNLIRQDSELSADCKIIG